MADARVFSTAVLPCRLAGGVTTHTWLYVDSSGSKKKLRPGAQHLS